MPQGGKHSGSYTIPQRTFYNVRYIVSGYIEPTGPLYGLLSIVQRYRYLNYDIIMLNTELTTLSFHWQYCIENEGSQCSLRELVPILSQRLWSF